jgi:hypothetical protein
MFVQIIVKIILHDYHFPLLKLLFLLYGNAEITLGLLQQVKELMGQYPEKVSKYKRRTKWLYLNVKNVVQLRKADANRKSVLNALQQEPC